MFTIGAVSRRTGVKIPTIRFYEESGLLAPAERTGGNQRRYTEQAVERLGFIRRARELGFSIEAIGSLIELSAHPEMPCSEASRIAREQLARVRERIAILTRLEGELSRISESCDDGSIEQCHVLRALADQALGRPEG